MPSDDFAELVSPASPRRRARRAASDASQRSGGHSLLTDPSLESRATRRRQQSSLGPRRPRLKSAIAAGAAVAMATTLGVVGVQMARAKPVEGSLNLSAGRSKTVSFDSAVGDGVVSATFTPTRPVSGGGLYLALWGRVAGDNAYGAKTRLLPDGTMRVSVLRRAGGVERSLRTADVPGTFAAGSAVKLQLSLAGADSTTLQARVWLANMPTPDWQLTTLDKSSVNSGRGSTALWAYASSGGTSQVVNYSNFAVSGTETTTVLEPTDGETANEVTDGGGAESATSTPSDTPNPTPSAEVSQTPTAAASAEQTAAAAPAPSSAAQPVPVEATPAPTKTTAAPTKTTAAPDKTTPAAVAAPAGGQPNSGNTGVPSGATLKAHQGDLTVEQSGAVIDGLDVHGSILVKADNVTIKGTRVRGTAGSNKGLIHAVYGAKNLLIEDSSLIPDSPSVTSYAIKGWNFTARRIEAAKNVDSVQIFGDNVRVENSWLHEHITYGSDPYQGNTKSHNDGVQILKGNDIAIVGNSIEGASNAAIQVTQDQGAATNLTFADNYFDNGTCSIKMNHKGQGSALGPVTISGNTFGRGQSINGCAVLRTGNTNLSQWSNRWFDGNEIKVLVDG